MIIGILIGMAVFGSGLLVYDEGQKSGELKCIEKCEQDGYKCPDLPIIKEAK